MTIEHMDLRFDHFYEILCDQWPVIRALTESKCGERLYGPVWAKCINTIFPSGSKPLEDKWNKISTSPSIFSLFYLFPTWDLSIVAHIIVLTTSFRKYIFSFTFRLDFNGWTDFFKTRIKNEILFFKKIYKMLLFLNMNSFLMFPVFVVWYFELECFCHRITSFLSMFAIRPFCHSPSERTADFYTTWPPSWISSWRPAAILNQQLTTWPPSWIKSWRLGRHLESTADDLAAILNQQLTLSSTWCS